MSPQRQTYFKQFESRRCSIPIDEGRGPVLKTTTKERKTKRRERNYNRDRSSIKEKKNQRPRDAELNASTSVGMLLPNALARGPA